MMKPLRPASAVAALATSSPSLSRTSSRVEALIEELAGGVVVLDRETRAGDAVILRGLFDQGQFRFDAGLAEIADADLDRVGRERVAGHEAQADRTDQPSDHGSSLIRLLDLTDDGGTLVFASTLDLKHD